MLRDVQQRMADVATVAEENIVGVHVVKAFAREDTESARFAARHRAPLRDRARLRPPAGRYRPLLDLLPQLAFAVIILVGGLLVIDGRLSKGGFITYNRLPRHADLAAAH